MKEAISKRELWQIGGYFFATVSAWIAGPIIAGLLIGNWIDKIYSTSPWWTLGLVIFAFIISNVGIYKESKKLLDKIEGIKNNKAPNSQPNDKQ